ncbi:MAG TPA: signal peptide peptidase SppA [Pirellulales bacterium]
MSTAADPPPPRPAPAFAPPPPRRKGWGGFLLTLLLISILANVILYAAAYGTNASSSDSDLSEKPVVLVKSEFPQPVLPEAKIAVISLEGAIMEGDGFVKKQIDAVRNDDKVKGIVLRVDSPGGTVYGSEYIFHHLTKLMRDKKLPTVVSMGSLAASGGYYVAMAVGEQKDPAGKLPENVIFAEPATWTGSIGVIIPHYDASGLADWAKIKEDAIKSHPLKNLGSPLHPMTEEERKILQALVDESFATFKDRVKFGRPTMTDETLTTVATGQIFTAKQAVGFGLVDKEGYLEDAINRVMELAKLDREKTRVIKFKEPSVWFDTKLLGEATSRPMGATLDVKSFLELNTPRAFYLFNWTGNLNAR